jgi:hypothetical protein
MKKFLYPGGMTDEAVSNAVDVTIQTRILRIHLGKFCSGRRFSEMESRSSVIPPGCGSFTFLDPGVSSLTLLNPRLISMTPPGSRILLANRLRARFDPSLLSLMLLEQVAPAGAKTRLTKTSSKPYFSNPRP